MVGNVPSGCGYRFFTLSSDGYRFQTQMGNGLLPDFYTLVIRLGWFEFVADFSDCVNVHRVVRVGFDFVP